MKTIEKLMADYVFFDDFLDYEKDIVKDLVKSYTKQMIDYIADNIEIDYDYHGHKAGEIDLANNLDVYVCKGEFEKIKELIK